MEVTNIKYHYLKIVTVVNIILGLLLLASLVFFTRSVITAVQKKGMKHFSTTQIESKKHENKSIQEYEAIFQNNPFAIPAGSLKPNSPGMGQTALSGIKLVGTISGSAKHGYAVFVGRDGKQSMFKTGESVFGAGELKIQRRGGVEEVVVDLEVRAAPAVFAEEPLLLGQVRLAHRLAGQRHRLARLGVDELGHASNGNLARRVGDLEDDQVAALELEVLQGRRAPAADRRRGRRSG